MFIEELGTLFKNDPTFDFIFNNLPKSHFERIVELRRNRQAKGAESLADIL